MSPGVVGVAAAGAWMCCTRNVSARASAAAKAASVALLCVPRHSPTGSHHWKVWGSRCNVHVVPFCLKVARLRCVPENDWFYLKKYRFSFLNENSVLEEVFQEKKDNFETSICSLNNASLFLSICSSSGGHPLGTGM